MRITKLYIKNYKNLKDFTWELSPDSPVITIVGKNASGKSNLLAALIHIFGQCNIFLRGKTVKGKTIKDSTIKSDFDFSITYQTEFRGSNTHITFKYENEKHTLYQNNNPLDAIKDEGVLPARIFVYYAGESKMMHSIIDKYDAWNLFTYLFERDNQFMLLSLFSSNLPSIKNDILEEKMNLLNFISCKITIKKSWNSKNANRQNFWNAPLNLLSFYQDLERVAIHTEEEPNAVSFVLNTDSLPNLNLYPHEFYTLLQQASSIGQIENISDFQFIKKDVESPLFFEDLSEGERQRIGLLSAFAVYQGKETLFLLDEPDAFAHPRWQWDFIPDIKHQINVETQAQQVILATHSPIIISSLIDPAFMMENGTIREMNPTLGNSVNLTLAEQDVPSRDSHIADDLKQYIGLIQLGKAQSKEALELRQSLEAIFGASHKEMQDADILISLYE